MTLKTFGALFLAASPLVGNAQADMTSGLAAYWTFDDGSGSSTAADSSGNGNTGTLTSFSDSTLTSMWTGGRIGGALVFNTNSDTTDHVAAPNAAGLNFNGTGQFTLSARRNAGVAGAFQTGSAGIICKGGAVTEEYCMEIAGGGDIAFFMRGASSNAPPTLKSTVAPAAGADGPGSCSAANSSANGNNGARTGFPDCSSEWVAGRIVRLFGASGKETPVQLSWATPEPPQLWLSNTSEQSLRLLKGPVIVRAWGLVTLRAQ